jgi:hypothetical protein
MQCYGSALASMRIRIRIQLFTSMQIKIRNQGDQNNADPGGSGSWSLFAVKKFNFLHKKLYFMFVIGHKTHPHRFPCSWIWIRIPNMNTYLDPGEPKMGIRINNTKKL